MPYKTLACVLLLAGAFSASAYSYGDINLDLDDKNLDISIDGDDYSIGSGDAELDVNVGDDSVQTNFQNNGQSASVNVTNESNDVNATISGTNSNNTQAGTVNFTSSNGSLKLELENKNLSSEKKRAIINLEGDTVKTIKSDDDLDAYNSVVIEANPNVSNISVNDGAVEIRYRHPARFLGIWSTSLNATARVENDQRVSIALPWYSFLFSTGKGEVEKTLDVELENSGVVQVNADDDASASLKVQNAARAINIVTSEVGGSGSASISGSNGTGVNFGF